MEILARKKGEGKWTKVKEQRFQSESVLQNMLYHSPEIIPIEKLGENLLRPKIFIKEAGLPGSGNTDLIGIDENGGITIIECKLATNTEIRRKVIGQVLEYAAYLWKMNYDDFDGICCKAEKWSGKDLKDFMQEKATESGFELMAEDFKYNLAESLEKGDFRLIIAVDTLNDELKRIIEFLNSRGEDSPHIYALEMRQFESLELDVQMIVPEVFGYTETTPSPLTWHIESFLKDAKNRCESKVVNILSTLYDFTSNKADSVSWGRGATYGSFTFRKSRHGTLISIFTVNSFGWGALNFGELKRNGVANKVLQDFRNELNKIPGVNIPEEVLKVNKYPSVNFEVLSDGNNMKIFQDAVLMLCAQMEAK